MHISTSKLYNKKHISTQYQYTLLKYNSRQKCSMYYSTHSNMNDSNHSIIYCSIHGSAHHTMHSSMHSTKYSAIHRDLAQSVMMHN